MIVKSNFTIIAKKLNHHHSSVDVFLKDNKKTGNYHKKKSRGYKKKATSSDVNEYSIEYQEVVNCPNFSCTILIIVNCLNNFFHEICMFFIRHIYIYIYIYKRKSGEKLKKINFLISFL